MSRRLLTVLVACAALAAVSIAPAGAEKEPGGDVSALDHEDTLTGLDSNWDVDLTGEGTGCIDDFTQEGFNLEEAELVTGGGGQDDAYDDAFMTYVNGVVYDPGAGSSDSDKNAAGNPQTVQGLEVVSAYRTFAANDSIRHLVTFTNSGAAAVTALISWIHDLGSDSSTIVEDSSSGDNTIDTGDSWFTTSDDGANPDPILGWVAYGSDDPSTARAPVTTAQLTPTCDPNPNDFGEELGLDYQLTVPPGGTCSMLWFGDLTPYSDTETAAADAAALQATTAGSPLLADLGADQLASIRNWDLAAGDGTCVTPAQAVTVTPRFTG